MKITVDRIKSDSDATISKVSIDGVFECDGLEDEYRAVKVIHETRIPAGKYKVTVRKEGGFHLKYVKRFPFHEGMLWVRDVPGFEYILIHCGNTDEDTSGCLLVGQAAKGKLELVQSALTYERFYKKVIGAAKAGELEIEYINSDIK
jgi:hypothetical protein